MSAALYLLAQEYRTAAQQLADLNLDEATVADTLESLGGDLETKAQSVAHMVRSMEADAAAVKQWAKDAAERAKAIDARADSLREYLRRNLEACGISKLSGPGIAISFRKSSAVVIDEPDMVPLEYCKTPEPPPPSPSKTLIGEALKAGIDVPGARIEHRHLLTIR